MIKIIDYPYNALVECYHLQLFRKKKGLIPVMFNAMIWCYEMKEETYYNVGTFQNIIKDL